MRLWGAGLPPEALGFKGGADTTCRYIKQPDFFKESTEGGLGLAGDGDVVLKNASEFVFGNVNVSFDAKEWKDWMAYSQVR